MTTAEIVLLLVLMSINALFAMARSALVNVRKARLRQLVEEGVGSARTAERLAEDASRLLATTQLGMMLTSFFAGGVVAVISAPPLADVLQPWLREASYPVAFVLVLFVAAIVMLILAELVPETIAVQYSERLALWLPPPLAVAPALPMPMVHLFKGLTFDFDKGEWVNAKTYHGISVRRYDLVHTMTKNFRQELELRVKLGALNKMCQEVNSEPSGLANAIDARPDWGDPRYITELVQDMKDQKYLGDGVRHLVRSLRYGVTKPVLWFKPHAAPDASPSGVLDLFDNVMEKLHLEVCKLCGVYGDDTDL